jgi:hypothetical protein
MALAVFWAFGRSRARSAFYGAPAFVVEATGMTSGLEAVDYSQGRAIDSDPDGTAAQEPPMQFNHVANRLDPQYFETVVDAQRESGIRRASANRARDLSSPTGRKCGSAIQPQPDCQPRCGQIAVADFFSEPNTAIGFGSARVGFRLFRRPKER